jgi:endonuclease YncB( thermonuclease family)
MKKQISLVVLVLGAIFGVAASPVFIGKAKVVDGDTLVLETFLGKKRIRLFGIDAVEKKQSCVRRQNKESWPCGQEATRFLKTLAEGRLVFCLSKDKDRYGRIVAACYAEPQSLNAIMVREGWAIDYTHYSKGAYDTAQRLARQEKRGIWSSTFEIPEAYRRGRRHDG